MIRIASVAYLLVSTLAAAAGRGADVCELVYENSAYHIYKGSKPFSPAIPRLDDSLSRFRSLVDEGICRNRIGTCGLRFDARRGGRYSIFKNGKRFTAGFADLSAAEALLGELSYNNVCVTPDADH